MLTLSTRDLRALAKPLIVLVAVAAVGATAVFYSAAAVTKAQGDVSAQRSALVEAHNRVQQSGQEKGLIDLYVEPYRQLEHAGVVGEEQRISWIDALRAANREADLYGVDYDLGPQQPYSFMSEVNAGSLQVRQSVMKLRLGLLHEGDLFRFFQALAAQKAGSFSVNACNLQPLPVNLAVPVNQPTLRLECELTWITIAGPSAQEGKS
jgi:hypothetical protein